MHNPLPVFVQRSQSRDMGGLRFHTARPVPHIKPVDGNELLTLDALTVNSWQPRTWICRTPQEDVLLQVSSYSFFPTQARFDWLVRNGLPAGIVGRFGATGPLSDADIDAAIADELAVAA